MKKIKIIFGLAFVLIWPIVGRAQSAAKGAAARTATAIPDIGMPDWKKQDFLKYDPNYAQELAERIARFTPLLKQVIAREMAGQNTELSHQILIEVIWRISATADFMQMDNRLDALEDALNHPEREPSAEDEDPQDGSWGLGCTQWFMKLRASWPRLKQAKFETHFIDRINSPEKLKAYFDSISISDIARTGIDNDEEFNESLSDLMRMILRSRPEQYAYDPHLKDAIMDLILHQLRDPATGYWGERYSHDGQIKFLPNMSITFHVVSYLEGDVPDMDKIVATTLANQNRLFPEGNYYKGQLYDHIDMDVATLFRYGWPHASDEQKKAMSDELHELLHFCLSESLQPDGSFKMWVGDFSKEESTYYGASFLSILGYFDRSKRFWTQEDFPDSQAVRQKILAYALEHVKSSPTGGEYSKGTLEALKYKPTP